MAFQKKTSNNDMVYFSICTKFQTMLSLMMTYHKANKA